MLEVFHTGGGHKRFPSFKRSVKSYTLSWGGGGEFVPAIFLCCSPHPHPLPVMTSPLVVGPRSCTLESMEGKKCPDYLGLTQASIEQEMTKTQKWPSGPYLEDISLTLFGLVDTRSLSTFLLFSKFCGAFSLL